MQLNFKVKFKLCPVLWINSILLNDKSGANVVN